MLEAKLMMTTIQAPMLLAYNQLTKINDRDVVNEDLVNLPNGST